MVTVSFEPLELVKWAVALGIVGLLYVFLRNVWRWLRSLFAPKLDGMDRHAVKARWSEIERLARSGDAMSLKMAILEADKLLDHALKAMAMSGNTLGERLKFAAYRYPKIRGVWWAHRLRNSLAHEPTFRLEPQTAKRAVKEYERTLRLINLL